MKIRPMIYEKYTKMELLHKDMYKGYNYYILNLGTHPTAYVEIPEGHKLYGKDYNDIDINVHGGLTYSADKLFGIESKSWFIGWDYAHFEDYIGYCGNINDKKWTTEEIIENCKNVIEQIIKM